MKDLPPPSHERSPWARPLEGAPAVEFELGPVGHLETVSVAARRPWRLIGVAVLAAIVIAAGVFVAVRSTGGADGTAAGAQQIQPTSSNRSSGEPSPTQATSTTAPNATAPPATAPATTDVTKTAPPSTPTTSAATTVPHVAAPPSTVGPIDVAPGTYSLEESEARLDAPRRFAMSVDSPDEGMFTLIAEVDGSQRIRFTAALDAADTGRLESIEAVYDVVGGTAYLTGETFHHIYDFDAPWAAIELERFLSQTGLSYDELLASLAATPGLGPSAVVVTPTPLGLTELDGELVMVYHFALQERDLAAAIDGDPLIGQGLLLGRFWSTVSAATVHVSVAEDNQIRAIDVDALVSGEHATVVLTVDEVERDFAIVLPDPADVEHIDIDDF